MAVSVIGVPKEIKDEEGRVSVQPDGVAELAYHGREVVCRPAPGRAAGFPLTSTSRRALGLSAPRTRCSPLRT
jgi:alanine dehydrogenase